MNNNFEDTEHKIYESENSYNEPDNSNNSKISYHEEYGEKEFNDEIGMLIDFIYKKFN